MHSALCVIILGHFLVYRFFFQKLGSVGRNEKKKKKIK